MDTIKRAFPPSEAKTLELLFKPIVPSPKINAYRTSAKLCLHEEPSGEKSIGLYRKNTHRVVGIPHCKIHHASIQDAARLFLRHAENMPFYCHHKRAYQTAKVKYLIVRCNLEGNGVGIVISHTGVPRERLHSWVSSFAPAHWSVYESLLKPQDDQATIGKESHPLFGPQSFPYPIMDLTWPLTPMSFMQANGYLLKPLIEEVSREIAGSRLLDLYGGFGAYSLTLASHFTRLDLVDSNQAAVGIAAQMAKAKDWRHFHAHGSSVENTLLKFAGENPAIAPITHIIVNPPRQGLTPMVADLLTKRKFSQLKRLVYVSCNPEALARDLRLLCGKNQAILKSLQIFDMFPQTDHAEVVAHLSFE
jgi:23S rRNA (uracil1939-C5)-methyltransferase